jgi:hypothetical protein
LIFGQIFFVRCDYLEQCEVFACLCFWTPGIPVQPHQLLKEQRYDDKGNDLWTTFNVVQENTMRGGLKGISRGGDGRLRRTTTRSVKGLDRNIRQNQALWFLTEKMAELKNVEGGSFDRIDLTSHWPLH